VIYSVRGWEIMPYSNLHWMGGLGTVGSMQVYNAVMTADFLSIVGTDFDVAFVTDAGLNRRWSADGSGPGMDAQIVPQQNVAGQSRLACCWCTLSQ
jgi:thiamine pyrophosphate-dependent acetolactate synthase large subunit-like protein